MSSTADGFQGANQPVGIPAQLEDGIRGLLFDTHYGHSNPDGSIATDTVRTVVDRYRSGGLFAAVQRLNGLR